MLSIIFGLVLGVILVILVKDARVRQYVKDGYESFIKKVKDKIGMKS